jgi:hypothetical protein
MHTLRVISVISIAIAIACGFAIAIDEIRRPQKMWIMNVVWPVTALFGSVLWLWLYWRHGRASLSGARQEDAPFAITVAKAASHCGAGCTLGDIAAEFLAILAPPVLVLFGWHTLFSERTFAVWGLDFVFAYILGIVFQFFTIAPMRDLGFWDGVWAAVKADTASLIAWQIGMYGAMAIAKFWLFQQVLGSRLEATMPQFWFAMQVAMLCGFATSYPVNMWLLKAGLKEKM